NGPGEFQVGKSDFPNGHFDVVFTANTFHIMSWDECVSLMIMSGQNLQAGAKLLIYGPFKYQGQFTSQSNQDFDHSLKSISKERGIRDFEMVVECLRKNGFTLMK